MGRNNTANLMDCDEFEACTRTIIQSLGADSIRFFTTIHDIVAYFLEADKVAGKAPLSLHEFEATARTVAEFLGKENAARFFKSMYETLPIKTIAYLGIMVKFFELAENYEIR
jgi:hypothetical protein